MSFIQLPTRTLPTIPTIDFTPFTGDESIITGCSPTAAQLKVADEINDSFLKAGIISVSNLGISSQHIASYFQATYQLFHLSQSHKIDILPRLEPNSKFGYIPSMSESFNKSRPADLKEGFLFCHKHASGDFSSFPGQFPSFAQTVTKNMMTAFGHLCRACELAGNFPRNFFSTKFCVLDGVVIRLNYFPAERNEKEEDFTGLSATSVRFSEHKDWSAFTMLFMDGPGLQVKVESGLEGEEHYDGEGIWMDVDVPSDGGVIVMVGETLQRWTNNMWKAPLHRVVNMTGGKERVSVAHFFHPDGDQVIAVHPKFVGEEGKKYDDVAGHEFVVQKLQEARR
eukprot:GFKZ01007821.1.p1 GENE.GFKZ01007821.1~~GFKZ01007821.1.p1  ORF type:complete len:339 (-),score=44.67 GFKZ01007821.1:208-1224(-)